MVGRHGRTWCWTVSGAGGLAKEQAEGRLAARRQKPWKRHVESGTRKEERAFVQSRRPPIPPKTLTFMYSSFANTVSNSVMGHLVQNVGNIREQPNATCSATSPSIYPQGIISSPFTSRARAPTPQRPTSRRSLHSSDRWKWSLLVI